MKTLQQYEDVAKSVRQMIVSKESIPQNYQEIIEQFLPVEKYYPDRRVITIYEHPDSNPDKFLENKRGFRQQFLLVFLTGENAADFYHDVTGCFLLKWKLARYHIHVADNIIFIKSRGLRAINIIQELQKHIKTQPLCIFHFYLKMREILHILDKGEWSLRIVWGPPKSLPLLGGDHVKIEPDTFLKIEPKMEIKSKEEEILTKRKSTKRIKIDPDCKDEHLEQSRPSLLSIKSEEFFSNLAQKRALQLLQSNQKIDVD